MPVHDNLGTRMKTFYEEIPKSKLMRRTPVAIRVDGRSFHTFTRGFNVPFDDVLIKTMQETMKYLCENIQGCVLGYTQSDEITLILVDYKKLTSAAFFDYEVQKICSITASMAHLIRLYMMCIDILEKEEIVTYREKERDLLMSIRNGEYLDGNRQPIPEFYDLLNEYEKRFEYAKNNTSLPEKPDYKRINDFRMYVNERIVKGDV